MLTTWPFTCWGDKGGVSWFFWLPFSRARLRIAVILSVTSIIIGINLKHVPGWRCTTTEYNLLPRNNVAALIGSPLLKNFVIFEAFAFNGDKSDQLEIVEKNRICCILLSSKALNFFRGIFKKKKKSLIWAHYFIVTWTLLNVLIFILCESDITLFVQYFFLIIFRIYEIVMFQYAEFLSFHSCEGIFLLNKHNVYLLVCNKINLWDTLSF